VVVLAVVAAMALWVRTTEDGGRPFCPAQLAAETRGAGGVAPAGAGPSTVAQPGEDPRPVDARAEVREGAAGVRFAFGDGRAPLVRRQAFLLPQDMDPRDVRVTIPFGDSADGEGQPLPAGHVRAQVVGLGPGRLVSVGVCVNPQLPRELAGGTYTAGALVGAGERFAPMSVEVTVQDDRGWLVALAAFAGVAAGLFVKLYSDVATEGLPDRLVPNLWSSRMLVAVGAGLATGVYSYLTIYADDPTFVARFSDVWRVTAETFAGTLAAKALTDLAKPPRRPDAGASRPDGEDGGGRQTPAPPAASAAEAARGNGGRAPVPAPPAPGASREDRGGAPAGVPAARSAERRSPALDAVATVVAVPRFLRDVRRPPIR